MPWVSLLVIVPLVAAIVLAMIPQRDRMLARTVALAGTGLTVAVSIVVLVLFDRGSGALQQIDHVDWITSLGISWDLGVDGISIWLVLLTTVLFTLGMIAACQHLPERGNMFLSLLLLSEVGLLGLFTSGDLVLFYVFWEFMLIPFAFLIWTWGGDNRRRAGLTFVVYTMVGSLIMLVAIISTALIARDHLGYVTFLIRDIQGVPFSGTA
ncbi:MAG: Fe-S-binding domain-containing protein, partial [Thermoleophilia bacterium]|nr:Fe-S-binding domain-containing protein [Thermoleophilia bacterium]